MSTMAQSAAEIAELAIAKQEAEENGTIPAAKEEDKKQDDSKKSDDKAKSTDDKSDKPSSQPSKDDTKSDDEGADADKDAKDKATDTKKEGKYTVDDALETDAEPAAPEAPTDNAGVSLSPSEQKYIVDNIGQPLVIRGIRGTGDNAKEVEIKAFSVNDIPADFQFANDAQRLAAQTGFSRLEQRAEQLLGNYRQQQGAEAQADYDRRENEGIRADLADLQNEGRFPKFTIRPGERGFDESPEAKTMAEVLTIMAKKNETYLAQYNQGRPFKHIGFSEAFDIWEAQNPKKQADKAKDAAQDKEDAEREKVADRVGSGRGVTQSKVVKPTVPAGTTINDILNRYDTEEW